MKTFQVWLVLEETEDDSPQNQIETYQMAVVKTESEGRVVFEEAQEALLRVGGKSQGFAPVRRSTILT